MATPAIPPMALPISLPIALPSRPAKPSGPVDSGGDSSTDSGANSGTNSGANSGGTNSRRSKGSRASRRSRAGSAKAAYPAVPPIYSHLLQLPALAAPFVDSGVLDAFPTAVQQLLPQLSQLDEHLKILLPRRTKNWTHELSTALLLSSRWHVATDRKLAYLLQLEPAGVAAAPPPPAGRMSREEAAARLLYAVACWRRDGYAGARKAEVGWQVDGLLAAFCEPGAEMDRIALADHASAVAVWCCGRAWEVQLFGDDGEPKSVPRLYRELQALALAAEGMVPCHPVLLFSLFHPLTPAYLDPAGPEHRGAVAPAAAQRVGARAHGARQQRRHDPAVRQPGDPGAGGLPAAGGHGRRARRHPRQHILAQPVRRPDMRRGGVRRRPRRRHRRPHRGRLRRRPRTGRLARGRGRGRARPPAPPRQQPGRGS